MSLKLIVAGIMFLLLIIFGGLYGCPQYKVWQKELSGKAQFKEAEWNRQIKIKEAEAKFASSKFEASIYPSQIWSMGKRSTVGHGSWEPFQG